MRDIANRTDIEYIVSLFYSKAMTDPVIKHIFEIAAIDLKHHLPLICDFWESILFDKALYQGNVMLKHLASNKLTRLEEKHFDQWLFIWHQTISNNFNGVYADKASQKANLMKEIMLFKIKASNNPNFIQ